MARTGGYPHPALLPSQDRRVSTCCTAGRLSLAVTQEEFLVPYWFLSSLHLLHFILYCSFHLLHYFLIPKSLFRCLMLFSFETVFLLKFIQKRAAIILWLLCWQKNYTMLDCVSLCCKIFSLYHFRSCTLNYNNRRLRPPKISLSCLGQFDSGSHRQYF